MSSCRIQSKASCNTHLRQFMHNKLVSTKIVIGKLIFLVLSMWNIQYDKAQSWAPPSYTYKSYTPMLVAQRHEWCCYATLHRCIRFWYNSIAQSNYAQSFLILMDEEGAFHAQSLQYLYAYEFTYKVGTILGWWNLCIVAFLWFNEHRNP